MKEDYKILNVRTNFYSMGLYFKKQIIMHCRDREYVLVRLGVVESQLFKELVSEKQRQK